MRSSARRAEAFIGRGRTVKSGQLAVAVLFTPIELAAIRHAAVENGVSLSEQIRTSVAMGMKAERSNRD